MTEPAPLDLGSLEQATAALQGALQVTSSPQFKALDDTWRNTLLAGVVQHFEFTFELCWKMLKRQLERELPSPDELDALNYRDLVRLGHERGLIESVQPWFDYRELRNITSHTYARDKALRVCAGAAGLQRDAAALLRRLQERNRD